ncbi:MAG: RNA-binding protein [Candidatus Thermoplasmatota archaeon]|nr:RNA-binding protein [Candidatus Thermoplasmatota archaeon]
MNIYVGNLAREVTEDELREAFEAFGEVSSAKIITDRISGESRGFGFVEMSDDEKGKEAMSGLDGTDLKGREIKVNEARPRRESGSGSRY